MDSQVMTPRPLLLFRTTLFLLELIMKCWARNLRVAKKALERFEEMPQDLELYAQGVASDGMSNGRCGSRRVTLPDEFPARPTSLIKNELIRMNSKIEKREHSTLIFLSCIYFLYGASLGLYGPLYPEQAKSHGVATYVYGPAMSIHFLSALLFYPVACIMIDSISCKLGVFIGVFVTGVCKIYFGTLSLVVHNLPFILLSYFIQIVEGIGFGILLAATCIIIFSQQTEKTQRNRGIIGSLFVLGIAVSPICGEAMFEARNFSVPFYGIGLLLCICSAIVFKILPEPDPRLSVKNVPILSWMKKPRMLIYTLVVFTTFNYFGFLIVTLGPYLRQFHLNKLFLGVLFSIPAFSCGLSAPGWGWLSKKGFNSVLLICISSLLICASLLLIGPPPFIQLDLTLANVSSALLLCGIGAGGKLACLVSTAHRDLRSRQSLNGAQEPLLIPTMFGFAALLGCSTGSFIGGFEYYYMDIGEAVYALLGLEVISIAVCFVFAFKRNYRSPRHLEASGEQHPILRP